MLITLQTERVNPLTVCHSILNSETQKKRRSRDAARSRRGQQNDEFVELANQLPLPAGLSSQLDRLCIMRLVNSYIKMKNLLQSLVSQGKDFILTVSNIGNLQLFKIMLV